MQISDALPVGETIRMIQPYSCLRLSTAGIKGHRLLADWNTSAEGWRDIRTPLRASLRVMTHLLWRKIIHCDGQENGITGDGFATFAEKVKCVLSHYNTIRSFAWYWMWTGFTDSEALASRWLCHVFIDCTGADWSRRSYRHWDTIILRHSIVIVKRRTKRTDTEFSLSR